MIHMLILELDLQEKVPENYCSVMLNRIQLYCKIKKVLVFLTIKKQHGKCEKLRGKLSNNEYCTNLATMLFSFPESILSPWPENGVVTGNACLGAPYVGSIATVVVSVGNVSSSGSKHFFLCSLICFGIFTSFSSHFSLWISSHSYFYEYFMNFVTRKVGV